MLKAHILENRLFTSELPTNGQESPEPHCLPSESQRGHSGRVGRSVLVGQQQGGECCPRKPTIRKSGLAPRRLGRFPFMSSVVNRCGHLPLGITKEAMSPLTCAEGPPPTDKVPGGPVEPTGEMKVYLSQKTAIFMWREAPPPPPRPLPAVWRGRSTQRCVWVRPWDRNPASAGGAKPNLLPPVRTPGPVDRVDVFKLGCCFEFLN